MQQVAQYRAGERDYALIKGDTGQTDRDEEREKGKGVTIRRATSLSSSPSTYIQRSLPPYG